MKHKNMTFSIPDDLLLLLHTKIGKRGLSQFISEATRKALMEKELQEEQELDAAYEAANKDPDRLETIKDWDDLNEVSDLLDNEDWEWLKNE
jgi:metal-responsive CopG/Arc/MetJ family transcriptional regulator